MGFTSKVKSKNNLNNLIRKLYDLDEKEAIAGFGNKVHPEAGITYAELANIQEFGSKKRNIPPRDFMAQAFHDVLTDDKSIEKAIVSIIYGNSTANKELKEFSKKLAKAIQKAIVWGNFETLHDTTIRLKGHDRPLQESGRLINNVKNKVVDKQEIEDAY